MAHLLFFKGTVHAHESHTRLGRPVFVKEHERKHPLGSLYHPAYDKVRKRKTYNVPMTPAQAFSYKDLKEANPGWTKEDHQHLAREHKIASIHHRVEWSRVADEASQEKWGRNFQATDYRISGIASEEFSEHHKNLLRHHAQTGSLHNTLSQLHHRAGTYR